LSIDTGTFKNVEPNATVGGKFFRAAKVLHTAIRRRIIGLPVGLEAYFFMKKPSKF
jgi:hypothetical protein